MPHIREARGDQRVLELAAELFESRVMPHLECKFRGHYNNAEILMDSVRAGKRLRPFYCLQAYEAAGGSDRDAAAGAAAAMELAHCSSLLIDDELDAKEIRPDRGMASLRRRYSPQEAIFLGTCLEMVYAYDLLVKATSGMPEPRRHSILGVYVDSYSEGITREIEKWKCIGARCIPSREEYWRNHIHSSGGLFFRMSGRVGAMLATEDPAQVELLSDLGYMFGQALQAGDDVKDLKPDMEQGYYSLAVVDYLEGLPPEGRDALRSRLARPLSMGEVDSIYSDMVAAGSVGRVLGEIARRGAQIRGKLAELPECPARANMGAMADFLACRMKMVV